MSKDNGGSAYPFTSGGEFSPGMTLRDFFATQAMVGHLASGTSAIPTVVNDSALNDRAALYYRMADAMLKARK